MLNAGLQNIVNTLNDRKSEICIGSDCNAIVFTTTTRGMLLRNLQSDVKLNILGKYESMRWTSLVMVERLTT